MFRDNDQEARFTFNQRKGSKLTDISEVSFKDKYNKAYENYLSNVSSVPVFKNK